MRLQSRESADMNSLEAAYYFGVSESTLSRWLYTGILPAGCYWQATARGRLHFKKRECEAWKKSRT